jgi:hypothetical protein
MSTPTKMGRAAKLWATARSMSSAVYATCTGGTGMTPLTCCVSTSARAEPARGRRHVSARGVRAKPRGATRACGQQLPPGAQRAAGEPRLAARRGAQQAKHGGSGGRLCRARRAAQRASTRFDQRPTRRQSAWLRREQREEGVAVAFLFAGERRTTN